MEIEREFRKIAVNLNRTEFEMNRVMERMNRYGISIERKLDRLAYCLIAAIILSPQSLPNQEIRQENSYYKQSIENKLDY